MSEQNLLTLNHAAEEASCEEQLTANFVGKCRTEKLDGVEYLVAKIAALNPGVLNGSRGPLLYTPEDTRKATKSWNQIPLVVYHPTDDSGKPISANTDGVVHVGFTKNANYRGKLTVEGWFDVEKTKSTDQRVYDALVNGTPMEVSTGLGTTNEEAPVGSKYLGQLYTHIARDHRPDHLAILPDMRGACAIKDGCGLHVNQSDEKEVVTLSLSEKDLQEATDKFLQDVTNRVKVEPICTNCGDDGECEACKAKKLKKIAEESIEMQAADGQVTNQLSHNDLNSQLQQLVSKRFGNVDSVPGTPIEMPWVTDVFDRELIFQSNGKNWRIGYSTDLRSDAVSLSEDAPVEVRRVSSYKTVQNKLMLERVGRVLTNTQRKEADMAQKLSETDRQKLVDRLVSNTEVAEANLFTEEDREVLNGMNDEKLYKLAVSQQTLIDQDAVVNSVRNELNAGEMKLSDLPGFVSGVALNAKKGGFPFKKKVDDEEEEEDDDEEEPTGNEFKLPKQLTEAEFMKMAPPSVRADLEYSRAIQNKEKGELINQIVANVADDSRDQAVNLLKTKPLLELRILANCAKPVEQDEFAVNTRRPNYGGASVPFGVTNGRGRAVKKEEILPRSRIDWNGIRNSQNAESAAK